MQAATVTTAAPVVEHLRAGLHVLCWATPDARTEILARVREARFEPLRAPHHTVSVAGLLGSVQRRHGGYGTPHKSASFAACPGEVTLAHGGLLLLDEPAEFSTLAQEGIALAVSAGMVDLCGPRGVPVRLGAACTVLALSPPCACGWRGHKVRPCTCSEAIVARYAGRARGSLAYLFDREVMAGGAP